MGFQRREVQSSFPLKHDLYAAHLVLARWMETCFFFFIQSDLTFCAMVLTAVGAELSVSDVDSGGKGILKNTFYRRPEEFESSRGLKFFLGIATTSLLTKRYSLLRKNGKVCQENFQSLECLILSSGWNRMPRTRFTCQRLQQMQLADSDTATHCNTLQHM